MHAVDSAVSWAYKFRGLHTSAVCECTPTATICALQANPQTDHISFSTSLTVHMKCFSSQYYYSPHYGTGQSCRLCMSSISTNVYSSTEFGTENRLVLHITLLTKQHAQVCTFKVPSRHVCNTDIALHQLGVSLFNWARKRRVQNLIYTDLICCFSEQKIQNDSLFYYQLDEQIFYFNTFIILRYMFRTLLCSSSGGQIVLVQHLVSSLSLGDSSVHRLRQAALSQPVY